MDVDTYKLKKKKQGQCYGIKIKSRKKYELLFTTMCFTTPNTLHGIFKFKIPPAYHNSKLLKRD